MTTPRPRTGRVRDERARDAVLAAALTLARHDLGGTTVDTIAGRAGVGKQTIYRWWRGKAEVVLEAINLSATRDIPLPDTGSLRGDLLAFVEATFAAGRRPGRLPVLRALMAEAQIDPEFGAAFDVQFLRRRREVLAEVLRRHPDEMRDIPVEVAVEVVFGVLWYRILATHGPLNSALARELTALLTD